MIELTWDFGVWTMEGGRKVQRALFRALKKSGGDAIRAMRAEAKRQVRSKSAIKASFLADKSLVLEFPAAAGDISSLVWRMKVSGRPVPLENFPVRQVKAGVMVTVLRGKRKLIKSAFLALTKAGTEGVFRRPGKARYPMGHKLGPRVSDTMDDAQILDAVQQRSQKVFRSAFARLLPMELQKLRR